MRRIISICKEVPLLPIAIIAAIPLALLGSWRPWEAAGVSLTFGPFNPGVGQWIVIALVVYTIVVTVIGMIDDLRHGHVGYKKQCNQHDYRCVHVYRYLYTDFQWNQYTY